MKRGMKISKPQRRVLEFLALHPDIILTGNPPFSPPWWNIWQLGKTPRLTTPMFNSLHMRELIHATKHHPAEDGIPERYSYQISPRGACLLLDGLL